MRTTHTQQHISPTALPGAARLLPRSVLALAISVGICEAASEADAGPITITDQFHYARSAIGSTQIDEDPVSSEFADTTVLSGDLLTSGVRAAGRAFSSAFGATIAANAQAARPLTPFNASGYAAIYNRYEVRTNPLFPVEPQVSIDFALPPAVLEIRLDPEIGDTTPLRAHIRAGLSTEAESGFMTVPNVNLFVEPDGPRRSPFFFDAVLEGAFVPGTFDIDYTLSVDASCLICLSVAFDPSDALLNPTVTVMGPTANEFFSTVRVEFPTVSGRLTAALNTIGIAPNEYQGAFGYAFAADVSGGAGHPSVIAAINDPTRLSVNVAEITPDGVAVTEPPALGLFVMGLCMVLIVSLQGPNSGRIAVRATRCTARSPCPA